MRQDILYDHTLAFRGIDGIVDDILCKVLITEIKDSNNDHYDLKKLISKQEFHQGDLALVNNKYYFVIDEEEQFETTYYKGVIRKAEKFKINSNSDSETNLVDVVGIADFNKDIVISTDQISCLNDEIKVTVPSSANISINGGVFYHSKKYKINSIDDTKSGLNIAIAKYMSSWTEVKDVYTLDTTPATQNVEVGKSYQLTTTCKKNGVEVTGQTILYTSSDESIATVSNTGLITAIKEGNCTITAKWQEQKLTNTVTTTVIPVQVYVGKPFKVIGDLKVLQNVQKTYTAVNTDGTTIDSSRDFVWSLDSTSTLKGYMVIISQNNSTCIVQTGSIMTNQLATLTAVDKNDSTCKTPINISIMKKII